MTERFDGIRDLIAQGDVDTALTQLRDFLSGQASPSDSDKRFRNFMNEVTAQSGSFHSLARSIRRRQISPNDAEQRKTAMTFDLLALLDEIDDLVAKSHNPLPPQIASVSIEPPQETQLEKVWGRNTLQSVAWLGKGLESARAVCRVVSGSTVGTGFLLAGGRVMTNNHVISSAEEAATAVLEFNFEEDERGQVRNVTRYEIDAAGFATNKDLDCSVMPIKTSEALPSLEEWGFLTLDATRPVEIGQHVTIIQHPLGGLKKISVTANEVVNMHDFRLHYLTDTQPGSSGAPVFDDTWSVIALHRAGGNMMKNAKGERIFANEGVLMRNILEDIDLAQALGS